MPKFTMNNIIKFEVPNKIEAQAAACSECGSDIFHAMLGPEDSYQSHQLLALQCAICGEEVRPDDSQFDS